MICLVLAAAPSAKSFESENLPPQTGTTGSPAPAASPGSPGASDEWQQAPPQSGSQSETAASPGSDDNQPGGSSSNGVSAGASSETPSASSSVAGASPAASPSIASDNSPPAALDVNAITTSPELANLTLEPEIRAASTPSLAASLRLTEDARKQLVNGGTDDAMRELGRAVSIDPGNAYAYFFLGRGYLLRKNYEQALTFFRRAEMGFAASQDWLGATLGYEGACYEELGKMEDAAKAYQRAVSAAPNNLMARVGYGRLAAIIAPPSSFNEPAPPADAAAPPPDVDWTQPPAAATPAPQPGSEDPE
jgi:hypothetical protein